MSRQLRTHISTAVLVALCNISAACDVDLFGSNRRAIVGPYGLYNGEDTFWVVLDEPGTNRDSLGGQVSQIGWNDQVILFEQETCGGSCPRSGWLLIHVGARTVEGPIDPATIKTRRDLVGIEVMQGDSAWKKLQ